MARPKKADGLKQPTVAPAPAMVPMPAMQMQQHQQLQHQMTPQHQLSQAIAQQPPMQGMPGALPPQQRTIGIDEFIRVRDSVSSSLLTIFAPDFIFLLYLQTLYFVLSIICLLGLRLVGVRHPSSFIFLILSNLPTPSIFASYLLSSALVIYRDLVTPEPIDTWMQPAIGNICMMYWCNRYDI